jgi:hypothetical protein
VPDFIQQRSQFERQRLLGRTAAEILGDRCGEIVLAGDDRALEGAKTRPATSPPTITNS